MNTRSIWQITATDRRDPKSWVRVNVMTWVGNPYKGLAHAKKRLAGDNYTGWTATWVGSL